MPPRGGIRRATRGGGNAAVSRSCKVSGFSTWVGSRLGALVRDAGLRLLAETTSTQIWTEWNPDESPAPAGCFSMRSLAEDLVSVGQLGPSEIDQFVSTVHDAARNDRFSMSIIVFAVIAESPAQQTPGGVATTR